MHKILLAALAAFLLAGCTNLLSANGDGWVVHRGDIVASLASCRGEENGEVLLQNLEQQRTWNDAMKARFHDRRCLEFPRPLAGIVHRVVRASVDFEDDIVFLVEFENEEGEPADIYSLVWEASLIRAGGEPEPMRGQPI